ncbi:RNA polymerase II-associated factor 1 homolog isoform X4 [Tachypleus tridentatus]|uniref:RNA polymerase II-associated factor 1 homolog isoform X4 n=1 Tax=Tachypleus tridentatus TaxID=6853 RepID=UPI003FD2BA19
MKYIKELILNLYCVFFISEKKSIYVDLRDEASLDLEDEKLLEEDNLGPQDSKRSRHHNKAGPWLKKTEYISTEFNRYGVSNDKTETKVGYNVKKLFKEENLYMDRESQINAINKTFEDAQKPIEKHCSKPGVYPLEVLPLFPDFEKYPSTRELSG